VTPETPKTVKRTEARPVLPIAPADNEPLPKKISSQHSEEAIECSQDDNIRHTQSYRSIKPSQRNLTQNVSLTSGRIANNYFESVLQQAKVDLDEEDFILSKK
jgi:hypothetical protein